MPLYRVSIYLLLLKVVSHREQNFFGCAFFTSQISFRQQYTYRWAAELC